MANLRQYTPCKNLESYIDTFWFFENLSGGDILFPVVPDGCSDIIFYLNDDTKLEKADGTFVTGVMEYAEIDLFLMECHFLVLDLSLPFYTN